MVLGPRGGKTKRGPGAYSHLLVKVLPPPVGQGATPTCYFSPGARRCQSCPNLTHTLSVLPELRDLDPIASLVKLV